jgi:hypothetical protein
MYGYSLIPTRRAMTTESTQNNTAGSTNGTSARHRRESTPLPAVHRPLVTHDKGTDLGDRLALFKNGLAKEY